MLATDCSQTSTAHLIDCDVALLKNYMWCELRSQVRIPWTPSDTPDLCIVIGPSRSKWPLNHINFYVTGRQK